MDNKPISREWFLLSFAAAAGLVIGGGRKLATAISKATHQPIRGAIVGANAKAGHLLRDFTFPEPTRTETYPIVIVGGGVSGLSAARRLVQEGITDFRLFELSDKVGGNAVSGENEVSAYPWGAHYLPVPTPAMKELVDFLKECTCITGEENGLPVYNELYLCADPQERLFIKGMWQDGLVPEIGVSASDKAEALRFFEMIAKLRNATGSDGRPLFTIPLNRSSQDAAWQNLDKESFATYLKRMGYTREPLLWYLNYCCRDDYGTCLDECSAWAGLHYFAGRNGTGANATHSDLLTWPEGNGFLINKLDTYAAARKHTEALVYKVELGATGVVVCYFDIRKQESVRVQAQQLIMATPQFVTAKLLKGVREQDVSAFTYAPWMVANITVKELPAARGRELSWDNVIYDSKSLGYVNACHQSLKVNRKEKVLTYYLPLTDKPAKEARLEAYKRTHGEWVQLIMQDLKRVHRGIEEQVTSIDVWLWGHSMIRPVPGFITNELRKRAAEPIDEKIFFAHTDLSGISNFEEGFYQGLQAADALLEQRKKKT